jgi:hypothetical protein
LAQLKDLAIQKVSQIKLEAKNRNPIKTGMITDH